MLITAIASLSLALAPVQQADDPARLLPPETMVYAGTHSVRAGAEADKNSAMRLILNEPEMKAFLQKPVSAADKAVREMMKEGGVSAEDAQRLSLAQMVAGEAAAPIGQVFVALTHVGFPTMEEGADIESIREAAMTPDVGLVVGMELLDAEDLGLIRALWSRLELPEETTTYGGREIFVKSGPEGWGVRLAFLGNLAVASSSERSLNAVIDRFDGGGDLPSLASTAEYSELVATAGGLQPGASSWMIRLASVCDVCRGAVAMASMMDPDEADDLSKITAILDGLGLDGVRYMGGVDYRELSGRVYGTTQVALNPGATGLLPGILSQDNRIDAAIIDGVPGNVLSMSAGSMDWLPAVYDFVMSSLKSIEPSAYDEFNGMLSEAMGESSLRDDLLANMNGTVLYYQLPGEGFPGTPTSVMRVGLRDGDRFVAAVESLIAWGSQMMGGTGAGSIELKASDHEGKPFYELDLSRTPAAMMMIQPAFAIDGDQLVFSFESAQTLRSALNGAAGEGSLKDNEGLMGFVKELSSKGDLVAVNFTDNAKTFGAMYTQIAAPLQMVAGSVGDLPVDLALMPSEQSITKHLTQSWTGSYKTGDGASYVGRSVGQFELGDFSPLLLAGVVLGVATATGGDVLLEEPKEVDPYELVQRHLGEISAGMTVYKISEGGYPGSIDDLVKPLADYPEGCLGKSEVPVDPWGNAYNFRLNERGKPFLWSSGPDGVSQDGEGDDIVKS
jgi:hypothetical protein